MHCIIIFIILIILISQAYFFRVITAEYMIVITYRTSIHTHIP